MNFKPAYKISYDDALRAEPTGRSRKERVEKCLKLQAEQNSDEQWRKSKTSSANGKRGSPSKAERKQCADEAFQETLKPKPIPQHIRFEHTHILARADRAKHRSFSSSSSKISARSIRLPPMSSLTRKDLMVERLSRLEALKRPIIVIDPTKYPLPALDLFHQPELNIERTAAQPYPQSAHRDLRLHLLAPPMHDSRSGNPFPSPMSCGSSSLWAATSTPSWTSSKTTRKSDASIPTCRNSASRIAERGDSSRMIFTAPASAKPASR